MTQLRDIASCVRSKNAGPFRLTIDIFFRDVASFDMAMSSPLFAEREISQALEVSKDSAEIFGLRNLRAIKVTIPRDVPAGSPGDRDFFGGQQFASILDLTIDVES
ncbi:DUF4387 family protein [Dactylosporangium sp. NPDC051484]|uniref:DUF4387 family protein n=1 Tax=Dactylosporangium sp. NPDC051484 TaxID=3154942 RepID=UPI00344DAC82